MQNKKKPVEESVEVELPISKERYDQIVRELSEFYLDLFCKQKSKTVDHNIESADRENRGA
jgi:hypothetical protein